MPSRSITQECRNTVSPAGRLIRSYNRNPSPVSRRRFVGNLPEPLLGLGVPWYRHRGRVHSALNEHALRSTIRSSWITCRRASSIAASRRACRGSQSSDRPIAPSPRTTTKSSGMNFTARWQARVAVIVLSSTGARPHSCRRTCRTLSAGEGNEPARPQGSWRRRAERHARRLD